MTRLLESGCLRRRWLAYCCLLLIISVAVRAPIFFLPSFNVDEMIYTAIAHEMLDGALYFRDVVDHKPPGIYYLYAGIYAVFGAYRLWAVHAALVLVVAGTGLLLSRLGAALFEERTGRRAGIFYVAMSAVGPPMDFQAANAELFMNIFIVGALLLYFRASGQRGWWRWFAAGLVLSAGAMIKPQAGFVVVALAVHCLMFARHRVRGLLLGAAGFAMPFAGLLWFYVQRQAWPDVQWAINFNSLYVNTMGVGEQVLQALKRTGIFLGLDLLLIGPTIYYFISRRPTREANWWLLLLWFGCGALAVSMGGRFYLHYYIQLIPTLALAAAAALDASSRLRPRLIYGLMAMAVIASVTVSFLDRHVRPAEAWHQDQYRTVGKYARAHTGPNERIFVWGDSPPIYFFAQRKMGARYLWSNYQLGRIWGTLYDEVNGLENPALASPETWPPLIADLEQRRPALIIDAAAGKLDEFDDHPLTRYPQISTVVEKSYHLESVVGGVKIYRLRKF